MNGPQAWLLELTAVVVPLIDLVALLVVAAGTVEAAVNMLRLVATKAHHHAARSVWIRYSRWLVAGLTFQLAADIVETSATPTWEDIGRIAAIAAVRTFLNFFLERDQREMREDLERENEQNRSP